MENAADRRLIALTGPDRTAFLQDIVTNDIRASDRLAWAALLTPQGKYLADFFVAHDGDALVLDVAAPLADDLIRRLTMYRLRRKVEIAASDRAVTRGTGEAPGGALPDPRHPAMGWRGTGPSASDDGTDWDALRVEHTIPASTIELIPNDSFPLEMGFERLGGVDFRKGCYVGQEVTARMKHKTELRKGLARVVIDGAAPVGTEIRAGEKPAGHLFTQSDGHALAYLRFDRAGGEMQAGDVTLRRADGPV